MKNTLLILSVLLSFTVHLQYAKAIVNKGEATVNDRFTFKPGQYFDVRPSQKINLTEYSIMTCKKNEKIMVYAGPVSITYQSIMEDLEVSKVASDAYFENMFSGNYVADISGYGSVDRGLDNENSPTYFFPFDSMLVISDSVILEIGNSQTSFLSDIKVVNPKGELLVMSTENLNYVLLKNLEPGDYNWSCNISVDDNVIEFYNCFNVPIKEEKTALIARKTAFQDLVRGLDELAEKFMMEKWKEDNSIYFLD